MPTSGQICSKLLQSSFPTFHHWWRRNSICWRDNSRRFHCHDNLCHIYNTAYSHDSRHHTSRWFIYENSFLRRWLHSCWYTITQLKKWWDTLCQLGPKFGCYPEGGKSWLIIKGNQQYATYIFRRTSIKITTDGQWQLSDLLNTNHIHPRKN